MEFLSHFGNINDEFCVSQLEIFPRLPGTSTYPLPTLSGIRLKDKRVGKSEAVPAVCPELHPFPPIPPQSTLHGFTPPPAILSWKKHPLEDLAKPLFTSYRRLATSIQFFSVRPGPWRSWERPSYQSLCPYMRLLLKNSGGPFDGQGLRSGSIQASTCRMPSHSMSEIRE